MKNATITKLKAMTVKRGATPAEEQTARAIIARTSKETWSVEGKIIRSNNGTRTMSSRAAIDHFIRHIRGGMIIHAYTVPFGDEFKMNDFYNMIHWMIEIGCCTKIGSKYQLTEDAVGDLKRSWNSHVEGMRL